MSPPAMDEHALTEDDRTRYGAMTVDYVWHRCAVCGHIHAGCVLDDDAWLCIDCFQHLRDEGAARPSRPMCNLGGVV